MTDLHAELAGISLANSCKVCGYLTTLTAEQAAEWRAELALPVTVISHTAVQGALQKRGINLSSNAVARHRRLHRDPA